MLFEQIKTDVTRAQKERNAVLLGVLRLLVSELRYKEIPPVGGQVSGELTDEVVIGVLQKEAKKRVESIEIYEKVGADVERYELEVIGAYLPKMMTEKEVEIEVDKIAAGSPLRGGQLVGVAMGKLRGKTDGGLVAKIVNDKYGK